MAAALGSTTIVNLALCLSLVNPAPIPFVIDHLNIVMALHGLIDHLDVHEFLAADGTDATARAKLFQARHGGPDSNDGVSSNHNYSDILLAAHHSMDLDSDGRLHLFEAAMWTRAANVVLEELIAQAASNEFQQLARGQSFITLHSIQQAGILSQLSENALYQFYAALDSDKDTRLSQDEFIGFRYPETSDTLRQVFATEYVKQHDIDTNELLSAEEFVNASLVILKPGESPYSPKSLDYRSEKETISFMFQDYLDQDEDGELNMNETMNILHPTHFCHAVHEAYYLFVKCDENGDHELSSNELLECSSTRPFLQRHTLHHRTRISTIEEVFGRMTSRLRRLSLIEHDEL
eukprot:gene3014-5798_t